MPCSSTRSLRDASSGCREAISTVDHSDFQVDRLFWGRSRRGLDIGSRDGKKRLRCRRPNVAMLAAEGQPRRGLRPGRYSSSPLSGWATPPSDRYCVFVCDAVGRGCLRIRSWAETPTIQWSREGGKGSVRLESAAALPNVEMTMSSFWDIT